MKKSQIFLIILASLITVFAGVMLFRTLREYSVAKDEYSDLSQYVTTVNTEAQDEMTEEELAAEEAAAAQEDAAEEDEGYHFRRNFKRSDYPDLQIDFKGLKEVNPEVVAWLYAGPVGISYPVVQKKSDQENSYYLHHTLENKENSSGCIFMDWEVEPDLTSWNTFFYGHNMKNGSMFGSLKKYIANHNLYDKDPYIYVFREEGIYRYKIYSYYLDTPESKMFYTCKTLKEYRAYIRTALEMTVYECKTPTSEEENSITLVTCSGAGAGKKRFFVHAIIQDRYLYPQQDQNIGNQQ